MAGLKEVLYIISRSRFHVVEGEVRRRRMNGERLRNKTRVGWKKRTKEKKEEGGDGDDDDDDDDDDNNTTSTSRGSRGNRARDLITRSV